MEPNIRNTKIKILRIVIEKKLNLEAIFSYSDIKHQFYIREGEFKAFHSKLFEKVNDQFKLQSNIVDELNSYLEKHNSSKAIIGNLSKEYSLIFKHKIKESYSYVLDEVMKYIEPLHWYYLPVYSDMMINNRGLSPEKDLKEYYNHYHSLEDMYKVCIGEEENWRTPRGDINLNQELVFKVYTNRWGHYDHYIVKRTSVGWSAINIAVGGSGDKKGNDSFIACFNQDFVAYPQDFKYVIERLWELADSTAMSVEELQSKLDDVAKMVSMVEKTVKKYTPVWY